MARQNIESRTFEFLKDLAANNNRDWFNANKERYTSAYENVIDFTEELRGQMDKIDNIIPETAKKSLWRIYRDIRFSKDKTPYKIAFSGRMKRATPLLRGGYYFRIQPGGESAVVGGFWGPDSKDMARIRYEIDADADSLREIIDSRAFKKYFGSLEGDELKTAPQGYSRDHKDIDLLRKKQFLLVRKFDDELVMSGKFVSEAIKTYKAMHPFFDWMSQTLTTDKNGTPVV